MSNTVQNGKGSARRPGDQAAFERNFARIKWRADESPDIETPILDAAIVKLLKRPIRKMVLRGVGKRFSGCGETKGGKK